MGFDLRLFDGKRAGGSCRGSAAYGRAATQYYSVYEARSSPVLASLREEEEGAGSVDREDLQNQNPIEAGIPLRRRNRGGPSPYPFVEMMIGDSFWVPVNEIQKGRQAAFDYAKQHKVRFETRTVDGGMRIWRVA